MVRFSDLLGGNDDADESRPATVSTPLATAAAEVLADAIPDAADDAPDDALAAFALEQSATDEDAAASAASPEDVLDRLTQYATSARAGDQVPETPAPVAEPAPEASHTDATATDATPAEPTMRDLSAVADDLLPRGGSKKPSRGRKRRP